MRGASSLPEWRCSSSSASLAPLAAEVGVQQVHHRPQVPPLLDVHLEQVSQVVQARRGSAQVALLLHRGGLGIALDDDQPLQVGAVLAGQLLPGRFALVLAERDAPGGIALGEEDAPAVVVHGDVPEVRPPLAADVDRGAKVDVLRSAGTGPSTPTRTGSSAARTPAPAAAAGPRAGRRCSGSSRCNQRWSSLLRLASGRIGHAGRCRICAARRPGRTRWAG